MGLTFGFMVGIHVSNIVVAFDSMWGVGRQPSCFAHLFDCVTLHDTVSVKSSLVLWLS